MKERPILFSGPMVRAILAGTKTQTRRICAHRHGLSFIGGRGMEDDPACWGYAFDGPDHHGYAVLARGLDERHDHGSISIPCPYGEPGDRLWVRETWSRDGGSLSYRADGDWIERYKAEAKDDYTARKARGLAPKWTPSIYMRPADSRISLEVTAVRVERLQDITEEDARAEGFPIQGPVKARQIVTYPDGHVEKSTVDLYDFTARGSFCHLWDSINGERASWSSNPWVWCVSFARRTPTAGGDEGGG